MYFFSSHFYYVSMIQLLNTGIVQGVSGNFMGFQKSQRVPEALSLGNCGELQKAFQQTSGCFKRVSGDFSSVPGNFKGFQRFSRGFPGGFKDVSGISRCFRSVLWGF